MRSKMIFAVIPAFTMLTPCVYAQQDDFPVITGPYLGREPPGDMPVLFPFDFVPQGYRLHSAPAFTPDGKEVYFSAMDFSIRFSEKIFVASRPMNGSSYSTQTVRDIWGMAAVICIPVSEMKMEAGIRQ